MRYGIVFVVVFLVIAGVDAGAQENVSVSLSYPSPYGSYNDLEIQEDLYIIDQSSGEKASISSDVGGNFSVNGSRSFYNIMFRDSGVKRGFSFLNPYSGSNPSCPQGYARVAVLNNNKAPIDLNATMPASGFVVCVRGTE